MTNLVLASQSSRGPALQSTCRSCPYLRTCGGLTENDSMTCGIKCRACATGSCDSVCFGSGRLPRALMSIDGFGHDDLRVQAPDVDLPRYIPMGYHRRALSEDLQSDWLAVPLKSIVGIRRGGTSLHVKFADGLALRRALNVRPTTKILLTGVARDRLIERFWSDTRIMCLGAALSRLDVSLAVPPNYSIWDDDPRLHHVYNRKRSLILAHDWTENGIPVAPYMVGGRPADWRFWEGVLRANPGLRYIVKEFQTGLGRPGRAQAALDEAAAMQDRVGRELHLIAVGGFQYAADLQKRFGDRWTVVESTPFIKAVKRQRGVPAKSGVRVNWQSAKGAEPKELFINNAQLREAAVLRRAHGVGLLQPFQALAAS